MDQVAMYARLSAADLNNLAIEAPDTPMHEAVLASLDAAPLLDAEGRVPLAEVRARIQARLDAVPELRRVLYRPGLLKGGPMWIDDPCFRIENHVVCVTLPSPGGEDAAIAFAERQMATPMDRTRPLWRIWLLEGYAPDRVGLLIMVHHALADGSAMVNMLGQVFDLEPAPPERPERCWSPAAVPTGGQLIRDSLRLKASGLERATATLAHPVLLTRAALRGVSASTQALRQAQGHIARTTLNRPIGDSRRVAVLHIPLAEVKEAAHRGGGTVNDLFLSLVAAGLRQVLLARGEAVDGLTLRASMPVSARPPDAPASGNHTGVVLVPLPVGIADPRELLAAVARATAKAKTTQLPIVPVRLMVWLARLGISRLYIRHQHVLNALTTDVPGPPAPLYFAGARVREPIALAPIAGNVTISLAALSYAGGMTISLLADGAAWPDLDLLASAMRESWCALRAG